jgi:thermitase
MIALTSRLGHLGKIIIICLLIMLVSTVCALETPIHSTILTENSQNNVSVSFVQNGTPLIPIQTKTLTPSSAINPAPAEISPIPTIIPSSASSNQNLFSEKNTELTTSSNSDLKNSLVPGYIQGKEKIFVTDSRTGQKYIKDQVIVRFKTQNKAGSSILQENIRKAHSKVGARVEENFRTEGLQLVQLPNGTDMQSAINAYQSNPDVLYAEPDYVISILPDQTEAVVLDTNPQKILSMPNDAIFPDQWSFHNTGQTGGTPGADIDAPGAWDISTGSSSVVVAVIDTGVLYTHSDLSANIWNNTDEFPGNGIDDDNNGYVDDIRGWDFVNNDNDPNDDKDHGTHVSGTIGAVGNNAIGVAGVNWQVKIMPLKAFNFEGVGSTSDAIKAIEYANANGATIISNSWGGGLFDQGLKDVIDDSPAVVVCAAGNGGSNNDDYPLYPASYNSTNIISVAASDRNDNLASFSNFGLSSVDLAAPGKDIWSTYLDGNYALMSGTSMATPHVSGVAALVKAENPLLTSAQIRNIIILTVDLKGSLSGKVESGGRLNASTAVMAAQPPVADFIGIPRTGPAPLTVAFTDLSTNSPTSWNWTFGDGSIVNATARNPVHTYVSRGNFTVVLNVTGLGGFNSTTKVGYINITNSTSSIGVFRNGVLYLRNSNTNGIADLAFTYGQSGDIPVVGDWDGDSIDTIGVFRNGVFFLKNNNTDGIADLAFNYGQPGDIPVTGDWNGDGVGTIGVFRNGVFYLRNSNTGGIADLTFGYGNLAGDIPVVGDWDGNGIDSVGVYRNGVFYQRNSNTNGIADLAFTYGQSGDIPVVGDWDGNGSDTIGVYRNSVFYLRNSNTGGIADMTFGYGNTAGDKPVVGDWDGV